MTSLPTTAAPPAPSASSTAGGLAAAMAGRHAPAATRQLDWQAFAPQEALDPLARRAQIRYMSPAGAPPQPGLVPAEGFMLVNVLFPPGHGSPLHVHDDAEEVYFVLRGEVRVDVQRGDEHYAVTLAERDLLSVPAGLYRREVNVGKGDAELCIMLGRGTPQRPVTAPAGMAAGGRA